VTLLRWDAPGYAVAFTTRRGGVSEGPYWSLNLARRSGDDVGNVDENRRRVCAALGADAEQLTVNYQVHGTQVNRARAGVRGTPGDGLWTDEPGVPLLALTADCVPVALVRTDGTPAAAVVHAGRLGILSGTLAEAVRVLDGRTAAGIGPAAGPCCYEVGEEVAGPFRERFGAEVLRGRNLDLYAATEKALQSSGCGRVERVEMCTSCHPDLFFSHRRDGAATGRQGIVARIR
jgi:polyphenol oxidase